MKDSTEIAGGEIAITYMNLMETLNHHTENNFFLMALV